MIFNAFLAYYGSVVCFYYFAFLIIWIDSWVDKIEIKSVYVRSKQIVKICEDLFVCEVVIILYLLLLILVTFPVFGKISWEFFLSTFESDGDAVGLLLFRLVEVVIIVTELR